jgi:hypothetical protein
MLNYVKRTQACQLAAAGLDVDDVARMLGCSLRTLRRELLRDDDFRGQFENAERSTVFDPLDQLRRQARRHWRAAAWLLERSDPHQFAPRRAAAIRPAELEAANQRLIEAALEHTLDPHDRTRMYRRLRDVADQACHDLLAGKLARAARTAASAPATPLADAERLHAEIDRRAAEDAALRLPSREGAAGPPAERGQNWTKRDNSSPRVMPAPRDVRPRTAAPTPRPGDAP